MLFDAAAMPWRGSSRLPDERRAGGRYNHVDPWVRDNPEANQSALDIVLKCN